MDPASSELQMELRPARADDVPAVLALWRAAGLVPSTTDDADSVSGLIARDAEALLVAEIDGEIVGSICGTWDGWRGNFYRLAVHPGHRRKGIALKLVARAERRIAALGGRRISSIVVDGDEHAVAFWRAAGYERDGRVVTLREESIVNSASVRRGTSDEGNEVRRRVQHDVGRRLRVVLVPPRGGHCQHARCPRGLEIPPSIPDVGRLRGSHTHRIACRPNSIRRRLGPCHLIATDEG